MNEDHHLSLEDRNYVRDARVTAKHIPEPTDGTPFHWEVCGLCSGKGSVVNPSIDASGLTAEDFDDDPDFAEDYRNGAYDIPCPKCLSRTTVVVLDHINGFTPRGVVDQFLYVTGKNGDWYYLDTKSVLVDDEDHVRAIGIRMLKRGDDPLLISPEYWDEAWEQFT